MVVRHALDRCILTRMQSGWSRSSSKEFWSRRAALGSLLQWEILQDYDVCLPSVFLNTLEQRTFQSSGSVQRNSRFGCYWPCLRAVSWRVRLRAL